MKRYLKKAKIEKNQSISILPPPPPNLHTPLLALLRKPIFLILLFLLLTLLLITSCECGVETTDKDKDKSSSEPTPFVPTVDVVLTSPSNNATNVPFSGFFDIIVDFDKNIQFNEDSTSEFSLTPTGGDESSSYTFSHTNPSLSIQSNQFSLHFNQVLSGNTEYTFTIPRSSLLQDTEDGSEDTLGNEKATLTFTTAEKPTLGASLFSVSGGDTWYERNADEGNFDNGSIITIQYPAGVENSDSSKDFPDENKWENRVASDSSTVSISGLPAGLKLVIDVTWPGNVLKLYLFGNAYSHERIVDDTSFTLTFPDGFFTAPNYTSADVTFSFDIVFGTYYQWSERLFHQALEYDGKLWIMGGQSGLNRLRDIWISEDGGGNWNELTVNGEYWDKRTGFQAFAYNDKLWVMGGDKNGYSYLNDIWTSADGTNWHQITVNGSHWSKRYGFQAFGYDGAMYVLGGRDSSGVINDIWTSTDNGTNWAKIMVTNDTHWTGGLECQAFAYDDKLWVLGGRSAYNGSSMKNEIWYSDDKGTNWSQVVVNDATYWASRYGHQSFVYDDKIWVMGGDNGFKINDIWYSTNKGTNWTEVDVQGEHWIIRRWFQAFPYDNKLWVLGGDGDGSRRSRRTLDNSQMVSGFSV